MSSLARDLIEKYKKFVIVNSETVGHLESASRILSYVAPGGSAAVSELLSSLVSLVTLLNDHILRNAASVQLQLSDRNKRMAFCLTILEYVEVFLELAAYERRGDRARWFIVVCVHVIRTVLRFILLLKNGAGMLPSPPIPSLKRDKTLLSKLKNSSTEEEKGHEDTQPRNAERSVSFGGESSDTGSKTFTLKSSGRVVRSLNDTTNKRTWRPPVSFAGVETSTPGAMVPTPLNDQQLLAECLHIVRPLVHLACMYYCGESSWKPWLTAFGIDMSSLYLMGGPEHFNPAEREELKRRTFMMLLYLLRSPFYDRFSRAKLMFLLGFLAHNVPVVRLIARPLLEYLPIWQKIYFYVWMS